MKNIVLLVSILFFPFNTFSQVVVNDTKVANNITAQCWYDDQKELHEAVITTPDTTIKYCLKEASGYKIEYIDSNYIAFWSYEGTGGVYTGAKQFYCFFLLDSLQMKFYDNVKEFFPQEHLIARVDSTDLVLIDIFNNKVVFRKTFFKETQSPQTLFINKVNVKDSLVLVSLKKYEGINEYFLDKYKSGNTYIFSL